jgi:hypothetical protein
VELLAEASTSIIGREPRKMSKIGSAMGMEHAEEEGSSKYKTLVYRKIPDISPARSDRVFLVVLVFYHLMYCFFDVHIKQIGNFNPILLRLYVVKVFRTEGVLI